MEWTRNKTKHKRDSSESAFNSSANPQLKIFEKMVLEIKKGGGFNVWTKKWGCNS